MLFLGIRARDSLPEAVTSGRVPLAVKRAHAEDERWPRVARLPEDAPLASAVPKVDERVRERER